MIASVFGLVLAWLQTKHRAIGGLLLSAWTGFVIGEAFSNWLYFFAKSTSVFWLIIVAGSFITLVIAATNFNKHLIWVTAIFGSYLSIVSLSTFWSRWPLDLNLPKLEREGAVKSLDANYWIYMTSWMLMSTLGTVC